MSTYTETTTKAQRMIDQSQAQNRIVTINYDAEVAAELAGRAEDYVRNGDVTEYWGKDADGTWRVHIRNATAG